MLVSGREEREAERGLKEWRQRKGEIWWDAVDMPIPSASDQTWSTLVGNTHCLCTSGQELRMATKQTNQMPARGRWGLKWGEGNMNMAPRIALLTPLINL